MMSYDAIVLGGDINSLTTASILAKEGLSVALFNSGKNIGGIDSTASFSNNINYNIFYDHISWIDPRLIQTLELDKYGLEIFSPDPLKIVLDPNEKHLIFYKNPSKTIQSIQQHSSEDANKWIDFTKHIAKLTQCLEPIYRMTPPQISELGISDTLSLTKFLRPLFIHGRKGYLDLLRTIPMTMPELMDEWFSSKILRGSLSASAVTHLNQGPYSAATGLNFLHQHMYSQGIIHNTNSIKGGTYNLTMSLLECAKNYGVTIYSNTIVTKINCTNNQCTGIVTSKGEKYNSNRIISGMDLSHTIIALIDSIHTAPIFRTQINNIKYRGSSGRIHFLLSQIPSICGVEESRMNSIFSISQSMSDLERAYDDSKYGQISDDPYIQFSLPSVINSSYLPKRKHLLSATIQYIPYHLKNSQWNDEIKRQTLSKVIHILNKFIPNFSKIIIDTKIYGPIDFESKIGLTEGNVNQGELTLDQFFFLRPSISSAQYKTSIKNLYFCSSATHPGGGLHGNNGINAAFEILDNINN